jgi:UDP-N-acetylglucosamine 2-epimerase (non-hydrolysing)
MHAPIAPAPRLFVVLGTRPEAIKLAPLIHAARRECWPVQMCATGQHRALLDAALADFGLVPDVDLALMRDGQRVEDVVGRALPALRAAIAAAAPDLVVVQGDTASAFAGALAGFYGGIPVAHVEAGLRSGRLDEPFPEEMHRRAIAALATLHFAPTEIARNALLGEGVEAAAITVTGNSGIDALHLSLAAIDAGAMRARFGWRDRSRPLVLATVHRRENHGRRLAEIVAGLRAVAAAGACQLAVTVHPAPEVAAALRAGLGDAPGVVLIDPLDHPAFLWLLGEAALVLTDSGGVQEEAPALGCPALVLRAQTERPEGIAEGNARLVPVAAAAIAHAVLALLRDRRARSRMAEPTLPYGDGRATARIVAAIARWWAVRAGIGARYAAAAPSP